MSTEIKYAFKNLIKTICNKPISFLITEIYMCLCILAMYFCYGVAGNYNTLIEQSEASYQEECVMLKFNEKTTNIAGIKKYLSCLQTYTLNDVDTISSYIAVDNMVIDTGYRFDGERFTYPITKANNSLKNNWFVSGRYFTESEFDNGEKVIVIPKEQTDNDKYIYNKDKKVVLLNGSEYKIVGFMDCPFTDLPITSVSEDCYVYDMLFHMQHIISKDIYNDIKDNAVICFGDDVCVQEMVFNGTEQRNFYKKMIIQESFVILVAGINILILFIYIIMSQREKITSYFLCGYSNVKIYTTIMFQWIFMVLPMNLLAFVLFEFKLKNKFKIFYPYFETCININAYAVITLIFYGVLVALGLLVVFGILYKKNNRKKVRKCRQ